MPGFAEYDRYDALGLADLVRTRQVTPLELVEEAIRRIELHNPQVNAVVHRLYDEARAAAQGDLPAGPFCGVPFLVKDLLAMVAGAPLSSGTRLLKDWIAPVDSELVTRWKAAGLIILGKTNTPEFGVTPYTEPALFGPTRNPYDLTRTAGGSSGGSGAAVAARMVPMASGGDGGGSIRIPAACCGLFGLKPTRGRTPMGPRLSEAWEGLVVEHVLTRSVRDSAALLDATAGQDTGAPYVAPPATGPYAAEVGRDPGRLRIAITAKPLFGAAADPLADVALECRAGLRQTGRLLETLGHCVEEAAPDVDSEGLAVAFVTMLAGQLANDIAETAAVSERKPNRTDFELSNWVLGMIGRAISGADYVAAIRTLQLAARQVGSFFTRYDILLTPTLADVPVPVGSLQPTPAEQRQLRTIAALHAGKLVTALNLVKPVALKTFAFTPYTPLFNVTGQPAMSVPLHWTADGLPVGMHFVGRFGDEATLFRLAGQLEEACPWRERVPDLVHATIPARP